LLAAALASPSFAADLPRKAPSFKAPVYVAPLSWTGFYVGINGGYGWGKSDYDFGAIGNIGDFTVKGGLVGGTLGYNLQTGSYVWGLEGDLDASWIKGTDSVNCIAPGCTTRDRWLATGRGRIGYAFDRTLIFATGGAAIGSLKFSPGPNPEETKTTKVGWTAGGGVEYALLGPWSVKAEYLYVDLGNTDCDISSCGAASSQVKFKTNIVRGGVNYRF
jgi:outer membrane immunogenic protein